ncbi:F-box domain-containing protein [Heracleum sosnowskyi]|uniref:F-box domain-containing protein n=1 Tax=Heracleum sosnowskyi TaxID=360622 RepID=A0AAD8MLI1_9APIA|nr:F-box domain-containing protein [Heracleum sosnowskyi]
MSSSKRVRQGCDKLSEDLIYEILLWLPVESLLRFKTVSKLWRCLISSPCFVESHCTRPGSNPETTLIVHNRISDGWFSLLQLGPIPLMSDLPFPYEFDESRLIGSDKGIVCIVCGNSCGSLFVEAYSSKSRTYLWNPATRHYKLIPPSTSRDDDDDDNNVALGFGFDPINNDFKVIRVVNSPSQSEVYSANLNAWRKVGIEPMEIQYPGDFNGCISGVLCWTGLRRILSFDLNKEVFTCVTKLPSESTHARVTDFNDSIMLIIGNGSNGKINLWTLDDVKCLRRGGVVEASWTLMLSIDTDVPAHSIHSYFNSGDILLRSDIGEWLSYNSVEKKAIKVSKSIRWGEIFKYTETLVSIAGFKKLK